MLWVRFAKLKIAESNNIWETMPKPKWVEKPQKSSQPHKASEKKVQRNRMQIDLALTKTWSRNSSSMTAKRTIWSNCHASTSSTMNNNDRKMATTLYSLYSIFKKNARISHIIFNLDNFYKSFIFFKKRSQIEIIKSINLQQGAEITWRIFFPLILLKKFSI